MESAKIKVGDTVYVHKRGELKKYEVKKVGRKYFYICGSGSFGIREIKIRLDNLREVSDRGLPERVWLSKQECLDEIERSRIADWLYKRVRHGRPFSLKKLRLIKKIAEEGGESDEKY